MLLPKRFGTTADMELAKGTGLNPRPVTLELDDKGGFIDREVTKDGGAFIIEWGNGMSIAPW